LFLSGQVERGCAYLPEHLLQAARIALSILVRNGADLVVVARAKDAADLDLVGAHLALGRVVNLLDVAVDLGLVHGDRVLGPDGL
jgi:hypothetical protein